MQIDTSARGPRNKKNSHSRKIPNQDLAKKLKILENKLIDKNF